jgi:flagellar assembly factor FliW
MSGTGAPALGATAGDGGLGTVSGSPVIDVPRQQAVQKGDPVTSEMPEITFVRPLPGFPDSTRYVLVRLGAEPDDEGGDEAETTMYELRCVEQPAARFLVAVPTAFFPEYGFDLDEGVCAELALADAQEALVLVLLTIGDDVASTTANLLAPVVINARTRSAAQVILSGTDWPVRAAVV